MKLLDKLHKLHGNTSALETERETMNLLAPFYDILVWFVAFGKAKAMREETLELAQIKLGDRVLDVGCGTGDLILAAKAHTGPAGKVIGIDGSPKMINVAQRKAAKANVKVVFQVGLIEKTTFPDQTFDVVLSSLMMHHLTDNLKCQGFAEVYRVLKPNGRFMIVDLDPTRRSLLTMLPGHFQMEKIDFVREQLPKLMQVAGFTDFEIGKMTQFKQLSFVVGKKV
ncbi:methyltransferase domain-containing protein [Patescibacteria group bacterium]|nr:methyltransferase domain-containing protein [Patescibacteria group bacterium]